MMFLKRISFFHRNFAWLPIDAVAGTTTTITTASNHNNKNSITIAIISLGPSWLLPLVIVVVFCCCHCVWHCFTSLQSSHAAPSLQIVMHTKQTCNERSKNTPISTTSICMILFVDTRYACRLYYTSWNPTIGTFWFECARNTTTHRQINATCHFSQYLDTVMFNQCFNQTMWNRYNDTDRVVIWYF